MVFIKLLGVLALIAALAFMFITLPNIASYRLSLRGSKYKEIPVCAMTASLIASVVLYAVFKNTFWGFVFAWSSVFLIFCTLITVLRYYRGRRKYCKACYVSYPRNYIMIANFAIIALLAVFVVAVDSNGAKIPERGDVEAVYFSVNQLNEVDENGCLNVDYAVIYPDSVKKSLKKVTGLEIEESAAEQVAANFIDVATDVRRDDAGVNEIISLCGELNHSFFKQEFSRKFRTSEKADENIYVYVTFKLADGKTVSRRYEYGDRDIVISNLEEDAESAYAKKLDALQHRIENPESSISEMGVYYHSSGTNVEQVFLYSNFEPVITALKTDGVTVSPIKEEPSLIRRCVYIENTFYVPPEYSAYGIPNRTVTDYYNIYRTNITVWAAIDGIINNT